MLDITVYSQDSEIEREQSTQSDGSNVSNDRLKKFDDQETESKQTHQSFADNAAADQSDPRSHNSFKIQLQRLNLDEVSSDNENGLLSSVGNDAALLPEENDLIADALLEYQRSTMVMDTHELMAAKPSPSIETGPFIKSRTQTAIRLSEGEGRTEPQMSGPRRPIVFPNPVVASLPMLLRSKNEASNASTNALARTDKLADESNMGTISETNINCVQDNPEVILLSSDEGEEDSSTLSEMLLKSCSVVVEKLNLNKMADNGTVNPDTLNGLDAVCSTGDSTMSDDRSTAYASGDESLDTPNYSNALAMSGNLNPLATSQSSGALATPTEIVRPMIVTLHEPLTTLKQLIYPVTQRAEISLLDPPVYHLANVLSLDIHLMPSASPESILYTSDNKNIWLSESQSAEGNTGGVDECMVSIVPDNTLTDRTGEETNISVDINKDDIQNSTDDPVSSSAALTPPIPNQESDAEKRARAYNGMRDKLRMAMKTVRSHKVKVVLNPLPADVVTSLMSTTEDGRTDTNIMNGSDRIDDKGSLSLAEANDGECLSGESEGISKPQIQTNSTIGNSVESTNVAEFASNEFESTSVLKLNEEAVENTPLPCGIAYGLDVDDDSDDSDDQSALIPIKVLTAVNDGTGCANPLVSSGEEVIKPIDTSETPMIDASVRANTKLENNSQPDNLCVDLSAVCGPDHLRLKFAQSSIEGVAPHTVSNVSLSGQTIDVMEQQIHRTKDAVVEELEDVLSVISSDCLLLDTSYAVNNPNSSIIDSFSTNMQEMSNDNLVTPDHNIINSEIITQPEGKCRTAKKGTLQIRRKGERRRTLKDAHGRRCKAEQKPSGVKWSKSYKLVQLRQRTMPLVMQQTSLSQLDGSPESSSADESDADTHDNRSSITTTTPAPSAIDLLDDGLPDRCITQISLPFDAIDDLAPSSKLASHRDKLPLLLANITEKTKPINNERSGSKQTSENKTVLSAKPASGSKNVFDATPASGSKNVVHSRQSSGRKNVLSARQTSGRKTEPRARKFSGSKTVRCDKPPLESQPLFVAKPSFESNTQLVAKQTTGSTAPLIARQSSRSKTRLVAKPTSESQPLLVAEPAFESKPLLTASESNPLFIAKQASGSKTALKKSGSGSKQASENKSLLDSSMNSEKGKKTHICTQCDFSGVNASAILRHMKTHTNGIHKCTHCESRFSQLSKLQRHIKARHTETAEKGKTMVAEITEEGKTMAAETAEEDKTMAICAQSGFDAVSNTDLRKYMKTHADGGGYNCPECESRFSQLTKLQRHIVTRHTVRIKGVRTRFDCMQCDFSSSSASRLLVHLRTHKVDSKRAKKAHKCPCCDRSFSYLTVLQKHLDRSHATEDIRSDSPHYKTTSSKKLEAIRDGDREEVVYHLLYDIKERVHCINTHSVCHSKNKCTSSLRTYTMNPLFKDKDNMEDDVTQVVAELLIDMRDKTGCPLPHSDKVPNHNRRCARPRPQVSSTKIKGIKAKKALSESKKPKKLKSQGLESGNSKAITPKKPRKPTRSEFAFASKLEAAVEASVSADREYITESLLGEMVSRVVCDTEHKHCQWKFGCRPSIAVYVTQQERRSRQQENMLGSQSELPVSLTLGAERLLLPSQQCDDVVEIVGDLMLELTNSVVCELDHTADKAGIRKCKPGEYCVMTKNIYRRAKKPPLRGRKPAQVKRPAVEKKRVVSKKVATKKVVRKKVAIKKVVMKKVVNTKRGNRTQPSRGTRWSKRQPTGSSPNVSKRMKLRTLVDTGNQDGWSDLDTDMNSEEGKDVDIKADYDTDTTQSPSDTESSQTTAKSNSGTSGTALPSKKTEPDVIQTDSKGVAELPDLGVDIVLANTSTDEDDTEPDSAGEMHTGRRKTLRKKKRLMSKEEREKQREQLIAKRRTTLKYMGTPRSAVLAQLIQEEAQKQCAEILLPKNLPEMTPEDLLVRPLLFPVELRLTPEDIAEVVNFIFPPGSEPPGVDPQALISDMCEVQSSGLPDCQLLYHLCMFISTSTTDPSSLHSLIQTIAKYSHTEMKRCPLMACNGGLFQNWTQVGTHLLLHLPPVYLQLMSQAFRCSVCWNGFPTPHHHIDHHQTAHENIPYEPAVLMGFPSSQLANFWASNEFAQMMFIDWTLSINATKRESVADYSELRRGEPLPPVPPATYRCCDGTSDHCLNVDLEQSDSNTAQGEVNVSTASTEGKAPSEPMDGVTYDRDAPTIILRVEEKLDGEIGGLQQDRDVTGSPEQVMEVLGVSPEQVMEVSGDPEQDTKKEDVYTHGYNMYSKDVVEGVDINYGVEQTVVEGVEQTVVEGVEQTVDHSLLEHSSLVGVVRSDSTEGNVDGGTLLEFTADNLTSELLSQLSVERASTDMSAYICWYCARPFIGRGSFYIHMLQEILALNAGGLLSGCVFTDVGETVTCQVCDIEISMLELEQHMASYHSIAEEAVCQNAPTTSDYSHPEKRCPCVGCGEVLADWWELGNHVITLHTPENARSMVQHRCTACNELFPSYYHVKDHWARRLTTCAIESRADAAESFTAHNLPHNYWTEDRLCTHNITFTKHKKYTFCSTYKTSSHLMCFVCQKLFSQDADDLDIESVEKTIENLQFGLARHLAQCHQISLNTGVDVKEIGEVLSAKETEDEGRITPSGLLDAHQLALNNSPMVICKRVPFVEFNPNTFEDDARMSTDVTDTKSKRYSRCGFHRSINLTAKPARHCGKCKSISTWVNDSGRSSEFSYVLNEFCKRQKTGYCSIHKDSLVAIHNSQSWLSFCLSCVEANPGPGASCKYYCDDHGPWQTCKENKCHRCPKKCKLYSTISAKKAPLHPMASPDTSRSSSLERDDVDPCVPATRTLQRCSLHPTAFLYTCYNTEGEETLVCRRCRMLGINYGDLPDEDISPVVAGKIACAVHPKSNLIKLNHIGIYCEACYSAELVSDIVCKFHPLGGLLHDTCGKVVLGCIECKECYNNSVKRDLKTVVKQPDKKIYCSIHYDSTISLLDSGEFFCVTCATSKDMDTLPQQTQLPKDVSAMDLDLCYNLFKNNEANVLGGVASSSIQQSAVSCFRSEPLRSTSCVYIKDDNLLSFESDDEIPSDVSHEKVDISPPDSQQASRRRSSARLNYKEESDADKSEAGASNSEDDSLSTLKNTDALRGWRPEHRYYCQYCPVANAKRMDNYSEYSQHLKKDHYARIIPLSYPCPQSKCSFVTNDAILFRAHQEAHGLSNPAKCDYCGYLAGETAVMAQHIITCGGRERSTGSLLIKVCEACSFLTTNAESFNAHCKNHEAEKSLSNGKSRGNSHVASHKKEELPSTATSSSQWKEGHVFYCMMASGCNHPNKSVEGYREHAKNKHPGDIPSKLFPCQHCYFVANRSRLAAKHEDLHSSRTSAACSRCFYLADNAETLSEHHEDCPVAPPESLSATAEGGISGREKREEKQRQRLERARFKDGHKFFCRYCELVIVNHEDYLPHMREAHRELNYSSYLFPCQICDHVGDIPTNFAKHNALHNDPKAFKCKRCLYLSNSLGGLSRHLTRSVCGKHVDKSEILKLGTKRLPPNKYMITKGISLHDSVSWSSSHKFYCRYCDHVITKPREYERHMKRQHGSKPVGNMYACDRCLYVADIAKLSKNHQMLHDNPSALKCQHCHFLTHHSNYMKSHLQKCKASNAVLFSQPSYEESRAPQGRGLASRMAKTNPMAQKSSARGESKDAPAATAKSLRRIEHLFRCRYCNCLISEKADFLVHMKKAHPDKPRASLQLCDICPYGTDISSRMKNHRLCHRQPKPAKCPSCPYLALSQELLLIRHKDCPEKPSMMNQTLRVGFVCRYCVNTIADVKDYQPHMKTRHPAVRPRWLKKCKYCPYLIDDIRMLSRHELLHNNDDAVKCAHCPYLSTCLGAITKHHACKRCPGDLSLEGKLNACPTAVTTESRNIGDHESSADEAFSNSGSEDETDSYEIEKEDEEPDDEATAMDISDVPTDIELEEGSDKETVGESERFLVEENEVEGPLCNTENTVNESDTVDKTDAPRYEAEKSERPHRDEEELVSQPGKKVGPHGEEEKSGSLLSEADELHEEAVKMESGTGGETDTSLGEEDRSQNGSAYCASGSDSIVTARKSRSSGYKQSIDSASNTESEKQEEEELLLEATESDTKSSRGQYIDYFDTPESVNANWTNQHRFACFYCHYVITDPREYLPHSRKNHPRRHARASLIMCRKCPFVTNRSDAIKRHIYLHRINGKKCPNCYYLTMNPRIPPAHLNTCPGKVNAEDICAISDAEVQRSGENRDQTQSVGTCRTEQGENVGTAPENSQQASDDILTKSEATPDGEVSGTEPSGMTAVPERTTAEPNPVTAQLHNITTETAESHSMSTEPESDAKQPENMAAEPRGVTTRLRSATAEPDSMTTEPQIVSADPHGVTAEPHGVTTRLRSVTAEPESITADLYSVTAERESMTTEPPSVSADPHGVTAEPHGVTTRLRSVTVEPETMTTEPPSVSADPHSVTAEPHGVTTRLRSVSADPESMTADPHTVSADPHSVTAEPHGVTTRLRNVTVEPERMTADPHTVSADPHSVAAEPHGVTTRLRSVSTDRESITADPHSVTADPHGVTAERESMTELDSVKPEPCSYKEAACDEHVTKYVPKTAQRESTDQELVEEVCESHPDDGKWTESHKFYCRYCDYIITKSSEYQSHMARNHPDKMKATMHLCTRCPFVTDLPNELKLHMICHSIPVPRRCPHCPFLGSTIRIYTDHQAKCRADPAHRQISTSRQTMQMDKPTITPPQTVSRRQQAKKPEAVITTQLPAALPSRHTRKILTSDDKCLPTTSTAEGSDVPDVHGQGDKAKDKRMKMFKFHCYHCAHIFTNDDDYRPHMKTLHPNQFCGVIHTCDSCPYVTVRSRLMERHISLHQCATKYVCQSCSYIANSATLLHTHCKYCKAAQLHQQGESPDIESSSRLSKKEAHSIGTWLPHHRYICGYCSYIVLRRDIYTAHMKKVHPSEELAELLVCDLCPFVTDCESKIKEHYKHHLLKTSVKCQHCSIVTSTRLLVEQHGSKCPWRLSKGSTSRKASNMSSKKEVGSTFADAEQTAPSVATPSAPAPLAPPFQHPPAATSLDQPPSSPTVPSILSPGSTLLPSASTLPGKSISQPPPPGKSPSGPAALVEFPSAQTPPVQQRMSERTPSRQRTSKHRRPGHGTGSAHSTPVQKAAQKDEETGAFLSEKLSCSETLADATSLRDADSCITELPELADISTSVLSPTTAYEREKVHLADSSSAAMQSPKTPVTRAGDKPQQSLVDGKLPSNIVDKLQQPGSVVTLKQSDKVSSDDVKREIEQNAKTAEDSGRGSLTPRRSSRSKTSLVAKPEDLEASPGTSAKHGDKKEKQGKAEPAAGAPAEKSPRHSSNFTRPENPTEPSPRRSKDRNKQMKRAECESLEGDQTESPKSRKRSACSSSTPAKQQPANCDKSVPEASKKTRKRSISASPSPATAKPSTTASAALSQSSSTKKPRPAADVTVPNTNEAGQVVRSDRKQESLKVTGSRSAERLQKKNSALSSKEDKGKDIQGIVGQQETEIKVKKILKSEDVLPTKKKIKFSDYLKRNSKQAATESPALAEDCIVHSEDQDGQKLKKIKVDAPNSPSKQMLEDHGIYGVTCKLPPEKLVQMKEQFMAARLHPKKMPAQNSSSEPRCIDFVLKKPKAGTAVESDISQPTQTSATELDNGNSALIEKCKFIEIVCDVCHMSVQGLEKIFYHNDLHDVNRCLSCNRYFEHEQPLRVHLANVHLAIPPREYDRWYQLSGKKSVFGAPEQKYSKTSVPSRSNHVTSPDSGHSNSANSMKVLSSLASPSSAGSHLVDEPVTSNVQHTAKSASTDHLSLDERLKRLAGCVAKVVESHKTSPSKIYDDGDAAKADTPRIPDLMSFSFPSDRQIDHRKPLPLISTAPHRVPTHVRANRSADHINIPSNSSSSMDSEKWDLSKPTRARSRSKSTDRHMEHKSSSPKRSSTDRHRGYDSPTANHKSQAYHVGLDSGGCSRALQNYSEAEYYHGSNNDVESYGQLSESRERRSSSRRGSLDESEGCYDASSREHRGLGERSSTSMHGNALDILRHQYAPSDSHQEHRNTRPQANDYHNRIYDHRQRGSQDTDRPADESSDRRLGRMNAHCERISPQKSVNCDRIERLQVENSSGSSRNRDGSPLKSTHRERLSKTYGHVDRKEKSKHTGRSPERSRAVDNDKHRSHDRAGVNQMSFKRHGEHLASFETARKDEKLNERHREDRRSSGRPLEDQMLIEKHREGRKLSEKPREQQRLPDMRRDVRWSQERCREERRSLDKPRDNQRLPETFREGRRSLERSREGRKSLETFGEDQSSLDKGRKEDRRSLEGSRDSRRSHDGHRDERRPSERPREERWSHERRNEDWRSAKRHADERRSREQTVQERVSLDRIRQERWSQEGCRERRGSSEKLKDGGCRSSRNDGSKSPRGASSRKSLDDPGNLSAHEQSSRTAKRHHSDSRSDVPKKKQASSPAEEMVMTTHDGQIVRLKHTKKGDLKLV